MRMKLTVFDTSDTEWDNQLMSVPHDVYHKRAYVLADDMFRSSNSYLFVVSEADNKLMVPLTLKSTPGLLGAFDASSPYGYPGPSRTAHSSQEWTKKAVGFLVANLHEYQVITLFLRLHPLTGIQAEMFEELGTTVDHGFTVSIPLERDFQAITAEMRKTNRYEIRKAIREGQVAEWDRNWEHTDDFYSIYCATMDRLEASSSYYFTREYFNSLREELSNNVFLWVTKIESRVAAASLITECDGIVQYHLSGTHPDFIRVYPTKVLLSAVADWANERGNRHFHLGGGLGGYADSLFNFKAGFGKGRHSFATVRIVVNETVYESLINDWKIFTGTTADPITEFFPPYRKSLE